MALCVCLVNFNVHNASLKPGACRFGFNGTHSAEYSCMNSADAKNKLLGIIFLLINCSCMAVYVLLQKRFIFNKSKEHKMDPHDLGRWTSFPISVTAHR